MKLLMRLVTAVHALVYRLTSGRLGGKFGPMPILLLESKGRRSGKVRVNPLAYIRDGDAYVITASAGGSAHHPGWYHNLRSSSRTTIQVMGDKISVQAKLANPEHKRRLWTSLVAQAPSFDAYQRKTTREIPMFILSPQKRR